MLEDVYASSDVSIVMMMFFELFYSEKFLSSQAGLEATTFGSLVRRLTDDQKVVASSPAWEFRNFSE